MPPLDYSLGEEATVLRVLVLNTPEITGSMLAMQATALEQMMQWPFIGSFCGACNIRPNFPNSPFPILKALDGAMAEPRSIVRPY